MNLHPGVVFLGGLIVIVLGAELVLRYASRLAVLLGVPPIVIGLTIVSVGTSTPELAIGVTAALEGRGPLAVSNIAGTNIVNILLILGLSAAIRPLPLRLLSIQLDVPVMIAAAIALVVMASDRVLSRVEGGMLVGAAFVYVISLVVLSRRESTRLRAEFSREFGSKALDAGGGPLRGLFHLVVLLVGIALSVLGANLLVEGAVGIARALGVSDVIIGLTIVAIGTSAPELATTVVATLKDDRDVAVGNLIGSSITNVLVILGLTCLAAPNGVDVSQDVLFIDLPLGAAVALVCWPVFRSEQRVSRREGLAFVGAYLVYLAIIVFVRA